MLLSLGRKCYLRNKTATKFRDIGTGDFRFRFRFSPKKEFHFRRYFRLRPKMKVHFRSASKLFQINPTSMIFKHSTIPVPAACRCLEKLVSPSIFDTSLHPSSSSSSSSSRIRVNRCTAQWPLAVSDLHSVDSSRALASSWTYLEPDVATATRRYSPAGHCLSQLSAFVGRPIHRQTHSIMYWYSRVQVSWPNRYKRRWRKMSPMVDKLDRWSTSTLDWWTHQHTSSICRWHLMWKASSVFMSATKRVHVSVP